MKLQVPFIQLPLAFDADRLAAEVQALGDSHWRPHPEGFAGNSMVPLVAVGVESERQLYEGNLQLHRTVRARGAAIVSHGPVPKKNHGPERPWSCYHSDRQADQKRCWYFMYTKRPMSKPP